ncbi:centrosomal protein of 68 kDa isoform X1 [Monodelphis domestica]|uniref:centrosomal protein of 68 kDa isoform X1 n=1 Tax=Monodelphis domestica TaxID=13616 RepID=UPI0024E24E6A|nr:centrosomal protein of 68 kDa isoform X1 [Monodelphis domestica]XP_056669898.1 centrosomal protein of 68 kDa isoform X1 [Monodelphis domestica]
MGPDLGRGENLSSMALREEKTSAESDTEAETVVDGHMEPCQEQACSGPRGSMQCVPRAGGGKGFSLEEEEELAKRKDKPNHLAGVSVWKNHHPDQENKCEASAKEFIMESGPLFSPLFPEDGPGTGTTRDYWLPAGAQREDKLCLDTPELPQNLADPLTRTLSSGEVADDEDDHSSVESPKVRGPRQQPYNSSSSFSLKWTSLLSSDLSALSLSSHSFPTSPAPHGFLRGREKTGSQSPWAAKGSSLDSTASCLPSGSLSCALGPGPSSPGLRCLASCSDEAGRNRPRPSFQAEYWACVLPDSLPPSPNRQSPLWNPNKDYEDLLDYTYPLKPKAQLPKRLSNRMLADPFLHDSGIDLDSFSMSPENTLKSPGTLSHDCLPVEADGQLPLEPRNGDATASLPPETFGSVASALFTSTPKARSRLAPGNDTTPTSPEPNRPSQGAQSPRNALSALVEKKGCRDDPQRLFQETPLESDWETHEIEIEDEYLALPPRLTQVSSLAPYLSTVQASDSQPPEGRRFPASSGGGEPTPSLSRSRHCCPRSPPPQVQELDREGEPGAPGSRTRTMVSFQERLAGLPSWDLKPEGLCLGKEKDQGTDSLLQCVKMFCCHLEELIGWLYKVAEVTDNLIPPKSNLASLKSSLQLYRQFKKDIAEHQSLTQNVLQKGEILLQCLLDNAPGCLTRPEWKGEKANVKKLFCLDPNKSKKILNSKINCLCIYPLSNTIKRNYNVCGGEGEEKHS